MIQEAQKAIKTNADSPIPIDNDVRYVSPDELSFAPLRSVKTVRSLKLHNLVLGPHPVVPAEVYNCVSSNVSKPCIYPRFDKDMRICKGNICPACVWPDNCKSTFSLAASIISNG